MAALCWLAGSGSPTAARNRSLVAGIAAAAAVALVTPGLWTIWRPKFLPWPLESYINGVHFFNLPQPWLFPLFPWVAFAFAGLTVGFWMFTGFAKKVGGWSFALLAAAGVALCVVSILFDKAPIRWFGDYDYWHTSPNFFLMRCGILLVILGFAHAWCCWGLPNFVFSPLAQLGQTSLLVYWVHIEFVYGRFSILPKGRCSIPKATAGLAAVFAAMLMLSLLRTRWKRKRQLREVPGSTSLDAMGGATTR
jgi:surface polysaccharide O-acyltransferase-like enzyme